ncbi:hypothetical protein NPIL_153871, partial [Nephila pilipes]
MDPRNLLNPWEKRNKTLGTHLEREKQGPSGKETRKGKRGQRRKDKKKKIGRPSVKKRTQSDKINRKHEVKEATCAKKETKIG